MRKQTPTPNHFEQMTTAPVAGLIARLAVPSMISMLVSSIYNLADTYFVSQIDNDAPAAVGVIFSLMAIIQALGFALGLSLIHIFSPKISTTTVVTIVERVGPAF